MAADLAGADDATLYAALAAEIDTAGKDLLTDPVTLGVGLDPAFVPREHLRIIGRAFADLEATGGKLAITLPPQVGKSTAAAVWGPFWWLVRNPRHQVIVASYGADLALQRGKAVRRLVNRHGPQYGIELADGSKAMADWMLESGGGMRCAGMGGSITGHSADLLIIDDPHKNRIEADSPKIREMVFNSYTADLSTRLAPDAPTVLILTRWHPDDLFARLIAQEGTVADGGEWRVLNMPALAVDAADPLGRDVGDPLPHPKVKPGDTAALRRHWARKRREMGPHDFGALCQGDPQPREGALVSDEFLRSLRDYRHPGVTPQRVAVAVDPAGGGRDTAGIIGGFLGDDGRLYYTHDRTCGSATAVWSRAAAQLAADTDATVLVYESNYGGDMVKLALRTAWEALQKEGSIPAGSMPPLMQKVSARAGKVLRAEPIVQQMAEDRVRVGARLDDLEAEWSTWSPLSSYSPGRIDASVYLAYHLLPVPGAAASVGAVAQLSKGAVTGGGWSATRIGR